MIFPIRRPTTIIPEAVRRPVVSRMSERTGRFPPQSFIATCERMHTAPLSTWQRYRERCTGVVDWDLPGRSALPDVPIVGVALNLATNLVPGGGLAAGALGLTGVGQVPNGYEPWIGVGGYGVGICPPDYKCIGGSAGGVCLGTCVPSALPGPSILPALPDTGRQVGPIYENGYATGNGGRMGLCCPSGEHPNKTEYFLKDGTRILKGSKCVKNRTTNPLNPRAASRAGRRLRSAAKASKWLQKCKIPKR
jgi:hypothetical protein